QSAGIARQIAARARVVITKPVVVEAGLGVLVLAGKAKRHRVLLADVHPHATGEIERSLPDDLAARIDRGQRSEAMITDDRQPTITAQPGDRLEALAENPGCGGRRSTRRRSGDQLRVLEAL